MIVKTEQQYETNPEGIIRFYTTAYDPFGIEMELRNPRTRSPHGRKVMLIMNPLCSFVSSPALAYGASVVVNKGFYAPQS